LSAKQKRHSWSALVSPDAHLDAVNAPPRPTLAVTGGVECCSNCDWYRIPVKGLRGGQDFMFWSPTLGANDGKPHWAAYYTSARPKCGEAKRRLTLAELGYK